MNILEFIRKNSLLVLIVIIAIGAGLLMMDYGNKGSMLSGDYYVQVNGTNYSAADSYHSGTSAINLLSMIQRSTVDSLMDKVDTNKDGVLNEQEQQAYQSELYFNPRISSSISMFDSIRSSWSMGFAAKSEDNIAVTRALLNEEAKKLGIYPNTEQIDNFLRDLPAFINPDGSFNEQFYNQLCGQRGSSAPDNAQRKALRSLIADIMIWESLRHILTDNIAYQGNAQADFIKAEMQDMKGRTAWLSLANLGAMPPVSEEQIKAYWEANQARYQTAEERAISLYTLSPAEGSSLDDLLITADVLMQDIVQANGSNIEGILEEMAANPDYAPFTYKNDQGESCSSFEPSSLLNLPEPLNAKIGDSSIGELAFQVEEAPAIGATTKQASSIKSIRGFYMTNDDKVVLLRVDGIKAPQNLSYEAARETAAKDCQKEHDDNAVANAAKKLQEDMQAALKEGGLDAAFAKAAEAGAEVTDYGPVYIEGNSNLPEGLAPETLWTLKTGELSPLAILATGARISSVESRTYPESPEFAQMRNVRHEQFNTQLRSRLMFEWLTNAYKQYEVKWSNAALRQN